MRTHGITTGRAQRVHLREEAPGCAVPPALSHRYRGGRAAAAACAWSPELIVGVLILAGFGAWGMFKPKAPKGWDEPGKNVIIGSESTTRYVVLQTGKDKRVSFTPY